jgi:hypothetical protein
MADTRLTKIGPLRALVLCAFAAFAPTKLVEAQLADEEAQKRLPQPPPSESPTAFKLTRGLWVSLAWVLGSMTVGYLSGKALGWVAAQPRHVLYRRSRSLALPSCSGRPCLCAAGTFRRWEG